MFVNGKRTKRLKADEQIRIRRYAVEQIRIRRYAVEQIRIRRYAVEQITEKGAKVEDVAAAFGDLWFERSSTLFAPDIAASSNSQSATEINSDVSCELLRSPSVASSNPAHQLSAFLSACHSRTQFYYIITRISRNLCTD